MASTKQEGPQHQATVRDAGIVVNGLRVMQRTDGAWILYSDALPLGKRTVHGRVFDSERAASEYAKTVKSVFVAPVTKTPSPVTDGEGERRGPNSNSESLPQNEQQRKEVRNGR